MSIETMGSTIAALRKEKNVTQEELADYVGVSAQAVSKWEKGGAPDCALLPSIADFFGVSVDTLFGRNVTDYKGVEEALAKKITDAGYNVKLDALYEHCWNMHAALFNLYPKYKLDVVYKECEEYTPYYSSISQFHNDEGYSLVGIDKPTQYFMLIPKAPSADMLLTDETDICALFNALADHAMFEAVILLCQNPYNQFTLKPFAQKLKIDESKASEVLSFFTQYKCIVADQVEFDYEMRTVYRCCKERLAVFSPILLLAKRFIGKDSVQFLYNGGISPIFR